MYLFLLANVLIDAFINIIQLIFVLYCYTKSIEVCILFFNIFSFFLLQKNKSAYTNSLKCIIIYTQKYSTIKSDYNICFLFTGKEFSLNGT